MSKSNEAFHHSISSTETCGEESQNDISTDVLSIDLRCKSSPESSRCSSPEYLCEQFTNGPSTGALNEISNGLSAAGPVCGSFKYVQELSGECKHMSSNNEDNRTAPGHKKRPDCMQVGSTDKPDQILPIHQKHNFWGKQPVKQYDDEEKGVLEEGPIAHLRCVDDVRTEPFKLPEHYEWCTCDLNCSETADEVYNLLSRHYVEDYESMFRYHYPKDFLQWALCPPGYLPDWHVGIRVEATKRLVAFITGIPANIRLHDRNLQMAEVNFLCIHRELRSKRLAPLLIKEVTRRVHLKNVWQAVYTAGIMLPTPIATCHYWHRPLNPKKLIRVGFSELGLGMTMNQTIKHYRLPPNVITPGFRAMERRDVLAVTHLLQQYLLQFLVAPVLSEADVEHWLVPVSDVVATYVIEDVESGQITDFCSFYTLPSTILGNHKYKDIKAAYSFYHASTKTSLVELLNDLLIVAKCHGFDVFNVLDIMHNRSFLQELKFKLGDGELRYYLYNYRIKETLFPRDIGLLLL
ncbi:hypothetical protein KP509_22G024100 [Ceratopteris richardii]|uniref:Glycylpeptide N-tetradecanoyltransferase n=1 Tax=Ceratopteris richardii TaxID=49495 RepID=A0A8T2S3D3_CERRI|nr:hypothetical protein KP509_22G024100 [Ceratopteris richardii]